MAAAWCLVFAALAGATQPHPPDFRQTTIAAIREAPEAFHRQWVLVTGTIVREGDRLLLAHDGARLRLFAAEPPDGEVAVRGQLLDVGRLSRSEAAVAAGNGQPSLAALYAQQWPAPGQELVLAATRVDRLSSQGIEIPAPPLPLEVYFTTPIEGEADVRLDTRIRIQFSRDIAPASLDGRVRAAYSRSDSIERGEPHAPPIDLKVSYNSGNRSIELAPAQPLERFRQVTVELLQGIVGTDGSVLRPWTLHFTTGGS
jgi:hypothetical protein